MSAHTLTVDAPPNAAEATTLASLPTAPEPTACANCGADRLGEYCHDCGQHYLEGRLSGRLLWREFAQRFLKLERGLGRTMVGLTRSPGRVARDYISGRRRTYVNPISYFLIGTAATLLVFDAEEMRVVMEEGLQAFPFLSPDQGARFIELVVQSVQISYAYQLGFLVLAMGIAWRLLFRRAGTTFWENTVPALYAVGHVSLFSAVLALGEFTGLYEVPMAISALLLPLVFVWAGVSFFAGNQFLVGLKTLLAFVLAFAVYGLLRDGLLIALVLLGA